MHDTGAPRTEADRSPRLLDLDGLVQSGPSERIGCGTARFAPHHHGARAVTQVGGPRVAPSMDGSIPATHTQLTVSERRVAELAA
jgi:hypothetical protein